MLLCSKMPCLQCLLVTSVRCGSQLSASGVSRCCVSFIKTIAGSTVPREMQSVSCMSFCCDLKQSGGQIPLVLSFNFLLISVQSHGDV